MSAPTVNLNFGEGAAVKSSSFSGGMWHSPQDGLRVKCNTRLTNNDTITGLFINNEFVAGEGGKTIDVSYGWAPCSCSRWN